MRNVVLLLLVFWLGSPVFAADREVECVSKDFRYAVCRVSVDGQVRLLKQLSEAACRQGRTWGYDRRGIWVDQGCAGRFLVGGGDHRPSGQAPQVGSSYPPQRGVELVCKSDNFRYRYCKAKHAGRVRLLERLSEARCRRGRSWGYDRGGVWVDKGCSARFLLQPVRQRPVRELVSCESRDYRYRYCKASTRGGVRLAKKLSEAACIEGRTWGYDRGGIWVDDGCAGRFEVGVEWFGR